MKHLLLFPLLLLAACKPAEPEQSRLPDYTQTPGPVARGDVLVQALGANPTGLLPVLAGESAASDVGGNIFSGLLTYDANLNLKGELAESWEFSNNGRTITFTLKPGLKFSNGAPLTSEDIMATYKAIINPNTRTPYAGDYLMVEKAEAPDARTFRVTYPEPFAPALSSWAGLAVLPKAEIEKTRKPDGTLDFNTTALKESPIGPGPYQLTRWRRGQDVLLSANTYSHTPPHITQMLFRILPDPASQWLELKSGNLDMAGLSPLQFTRQTDETWFTRQYIKHSWLSNAYSFMGFNLKHPLFEDKTTRQALSHAIDREGLIAAVLYGQGQPIAGVFKPGTWAYNPNIQPYAFNPEKAKAMLAQQGWAPGPGGILHKNGQRFEFTVTTNQGNSIRLKAAQVMQKMFADIGVKMNIRVQEWSSFITNTVKNRDFEAILLGWSLSIEPDPYDIWHSSKTKPEEFNIIGYSNAEADQLMVAARKEFNQEARKQLLWRFQEILSDDQPYLWLYAPNTLLAVHRRIAGITPAPAGIGYNQPEWYVPQAWQLRTALKP